MYGGDGLQPSPFPPGVNPFEGFPDADELEAVYRENEVYILHPHQLSDPNTLIFNFPVAGMVTDDDIREHMTRIYTHDATQNAFKIEIAAGVILRHSETGHTRYFRPESNAFILDSPLVITDYNTLQDAIEILIQSGLDNMIRSFRPDTKYVVQMITQLNYYSWALAFPLGAKVDIVPQHIRENRSIMSRTSIDGYDNCCIFVALSAFRHPEHDPRWKKKDVQNLFARWVTYGVELGILPKNHTRLPEKYGGFEWNHLSNFEKCFQVNIVIMHYAEDKTVTTKYTSHGEFTDTMYLNINNDHLSLITNIHSYTHRYQCHHCRRLFTQFYLVTRHQRACKKMARLKFPAASYVYFKSVFDELSHVGIIVPPDKRVNPWFVVYDFESILAKCDFQTAGKQTRYTSMHIPVSVSVCSNIPGYTKPHFIMSKYPRQVLRQMMQYLEEVRQALCEITNNRWGSYLAHLKSKLRERKDTLSRQFARKQNATEGDATARTQCGMKDYFENKKKFVSADPMMCLLLRLYKRFSLYINRMTVLGFNSQKYDLKLVMGYLIEYMLLDKVKQEIKAESVDALLGETEEGRDFVEVDIKVHDDTVSDTEYNESEDVFSWMQDSVCAETIEKMFEAKTDGGFDIVNDVNIDDMIKVFALDEAGPPQVLKRNNAYASVGNNFFTFLDVCNYLPPGTNYKKFLTTYAAEGSKSYFPYEYCSSYEKLFDPLPPYDDPGWTSVLRGGAHLLEQECSEDAGAKTGREIYNDLVAYMKQNNMSTLADLLKVYNNCDTVPFVSAVMNMQVEYFKQGLDVFKVAVSIPGIARIKLMQYSQAQGIHFSLCHKDDSDMYHLMKTQTVGGPSIVFNRFAKVGKTFLRDDKKVLTALVEGFDCNALYTHCFRSPMPCFMYVRRFAPDFRPQYRPQYLIMYIWMEDMASQLGIRIRHKMNLGHDIRAGEYLLDGLGVTDDGQMIAFEYLSCYHHGHTCQHPRTTFHDSVLRKWEEKKKALLASGYDVCSIWDCTFRNIMYNEKPDLLQQYNSMRPEFLKHHPKGVTEETILEAVRIGSLFGFLVVDLRCPPELKEHFEDFPPIFANHDISYNDIVSVMQDHVKSTNIKLTNRRVLLSGFEADEFLVNTRLLRFYLELGLIVSKVHEVIEYCERVPFADFVQQITEHRKAAACDPSRAVAGNIYKLIG